MRIHAVISMIACVFLLCGCMPKMQVKWVEPAQASVQIYKCKASGKRGDMMEVGQLPATFRLEQGRYQVIVRPSDGYLNEIGYTNPDVPNPTLYGFLNVGGLTENAKLAKVPIQFDKDLLAKAIKEGIVIKTETTDDAVVVMGQTRSYTLLQLKMGDQDPDVDY